MLEGLCTDIFIRISIIEVLRPHTPLACGLCIDISIVTRVHLASANLNPLNIELEDTQKNEASLGRSQVGSTELAIVKGWVSSYGHEAQSILGH